jgi:uncharacterized protein YndB with AHSA1/START domain
MAQIETTIVIAATPDAVWRVLGDVMQWPEWLPTVNRIAAQGNANPVVGASYLLEQPKLQPATWVITSYDPPSGFTWKTAGPGYRVVGDHQITPTNDGQSQVTLSIQYSGLLGGLIGLASGKLTMEYITREAAALKATVLARDPTSTK